MSQRVLATAGVALAALAVGAPSASADFPADHSFIVGAARSNMTEIAGARLALARSHSKPVRDYARRILADHVQAQQRLEAAARVTHTTLPKEPSAAQKRDIARLAAVPMGRFDGRFCSRQMVGHRKAMGAILLELDSGRNRQARAYAGWLLPVARSHMELARKAMAEMERSG
jgi:putative membrane protein